MSGLMHKVKDALQGGHKDENAKLAHEGLQGEHGSQSGVHDTPIQGSVAHGDSVSPTNPGVLSSTKHGIHGDRDTGTSGSGLSNQGLTGQTGTEGESGSVAHGSSVSPTNPGVLHSTKPGIHGARDAGIGSTGLSNSELMQDSGAGSGIGSGTGSGIAAGTGSGYDSTSRDTGLDSGNTAGPQYTGTSKRDTGLVGSGVDSTGRGTTMDESSMNAGSGSSYNPNDRGNAGLSGEDVLTGSGSRNRDTGIGGGVGSGHDSSSRMNRDDTTTGSGLNRDDGLIAGSSVPQTGSGYDTKTRGADLTSGGTGSGLTGNDSGIGSDYDSNTRGTGLTGKDSGIGSDYDSNNRGTGLTGGTSGTGSGYDSNTRDTGLTGGTSSGTGIGESGPALTAFGGDSGLHSSSSGSGRTTGGVASEAEKYIEGSEKHHRGDGHPEDIVHEGPHYTQTAKALDPHLN